MVNSKPWYKNTATLECIPQLSPISLFVNNRTSVLAERQLALPSLGSSRQSPHDWVLVRHKRKCGVGRLIKISCLFWKKKSLLSLLCFPLLLSLVYNLGTVAGASKTFQVHEVTLKLEAYARHVEEQKLRKKPESLVTTELTHPSCTAYLWINFAIERTNNFATYVTVILGFLSPFMFSVYVSVWVFSYT